MTLKEAEVTLKKKSVKFSDSFIKRIKEFTPYGIFSGRVPFISWSSHFYNNRYDFRSLSDTYLAFTRLIPKLSLRQFLTFCKKNNGKNTTEDNFFFCFSFCQDIKKIILYFSPTKKTLSYYPEYNLEKREEKDFTNLVELTIWKYFIK